MDHLGLSWWIIWDLLERAKGKLPDKNQQQLISTESWKSETYISLVFCCALQKKIPMKDWWFHSKLKRTTNCYILCLKTIACWVTSWFNTPVCILIESDNILTVWPLEMEYFKLGIIHTTYFLCLICICVPGFLYSHGSTVPSLLSNIVTFIIKPNAFGLYMGVVGEQEEL